MTPDQIQALHNAKTKIKTFRDALLRRQHALDLPASSSTPGFFARYLCCCFTPKKAITLAIQDGHEVSNAYASIIRALEHLHDFSLKTAIETNGTLSEAIPGTLSTLSAKIDKALAGATSAIHHVQSDKEQRLLVNQLHKLIALIDDHLPGIESDLAEAGIVQINNEFGYQTLSGRGSVNRI